MRNLFTILVLVLVTGCQNSLPDDIVLLNKYIVVDGSLGQNLHHCSHEIKPFREMEVYDCSFSLSNIKFNIREKFKLSLEGDLEEYWSYLSEGPLIYTEEDFQDDIKFVEYIGGSKLKIVKRGNYIYDSGDTLKIERVNSSEKLIFIESNGLKLSKGGNRILFEYKDN